MHQGKMLKMIGLQIKGTLFLVGNPTVGKQVFEKDPGAGLYLPRRVYLYQGSDGKTYLSYDKPSALLKPFNDSAIDQTTGMLDHKLAALTQIVAPIGGVDGREDVNLRPSTAQITTGANQQRPPPESPAEAN